MTAATSTIFVFPLARRRRKVQTVAATLLARKTEEGRENYWQQIVDGLCLEMERHGVAREEVGRQLNAFHKAISLDLQRINHHAGAPPGAA